MNELEKCMAGQYYDCHDEIFLSFKAQARQLLKAYNALAYEQKEEKTTILKQLFGGIGTNVSVGLPFICDKRCSAKFVSCGKSLPDNTENK